MKTNFLKLSILTLFTASVFTSCVKDDDFDIPNFKCNEVNITANKTVADVYALAGTTIQQYPEVIGGDDYLEAYVVSSDRGGNFFKSLSLQTVPTQANPQPLGFSIPVDVVSLSNIFEVGRKVYVKLDKRYFNITNGSLIIGEIFIGSTGNVSVGRISPFDYGNVLFRSCEVKPEADLVRTLTVNQAKQDINLNTLIELDGVQFVDAAVGKTYFDPNAVVGGATNHLLTDATGNTVIFRTSSFANYAGQVVPGENGKVRGVMTKFGSDYQFIARTFNDIQLTNPRVEIDFAPPIVGNNLTFLSTLNENFESYTAGTNTTGQNNFPMYINDAVVGSAYWRCRSNGTPANKFIQMTAFSTSSACRTYFIVPVNFTAANTFSFQSRASFNVGAVLKVYYTTNYTPGGPINMANLTDITSTFTISTANSATAAFTPSGTWNIPASLTGNGYILFEYTGSAVSSPALTTNMDLDNIVIN
ncbi:MAG: DUF5689 domain-containing protein [Flavobacterium sp.]